MRLLRLSLRTSKPEKRLIYLKLYKEIKNIT